MGDWNRDGILDLIFLLKRQTGTHTTEVHILSGASNFQQFIYEAGTALNEVDNRYTLSMGDWNRDGVLDLLFFYKNFTGSHTTEVFALSGASNFQQYTLGASTALHETDERFSLHLAKWDTDNILDMILLTKRTTPSHTTEFYALPGKYNFQRIEGFSATGLIETDERFALTLADWDRDGKLDLIFVLRSFDGLPFGGTHSTEIHILSGASNFQQYILQKGTPLPEDRRTATLTITKSGTGSGRVTAPGIDCGGDCSETYAVGTQLGLTATADAGSTFAGWQGHADCADGSLSMTDNRACTAVFNVPPPPPACQTDFRTTVRVEDRSGKAGETIALRATLTRDCEGSGLNGKSLIFKVKGAEVGTATTTSSGVATLSYRIDPSFPVGSSHPIRVEFANDAQYRPATGGGTLRVLSPSAVGSTVSVPNVSAAIGQTATITASLRRATDGANLSGKSLSFAVNGTALGNAATNATGVAKLQYQIPDSLGLGNKTLVVTFAGDGEYTGSSATGTLTVGKADTRIEVSDRSGQIGDTISLRGVLERTTGKSLGERTLIFRVAGATVGSAKTNSSGVATLNYKIPEMTPGPKSITVEFAGDSLDNPSTGVGELKVLKADTFLRVERDPPSGNPIKAIKATLTRRSDGAPLPNKTLTFKLRDGRVTETGTTDAAGVYRTHHTLICNEDVSFAGDGLYNGSSGQFRHDSLSINCPP